jgi:magnesium chelatase family protein
MLAKALNSILPPLSFEESLEVTRIYSSAGLLSEGSSLIRKRPFRAPHHTTSFAGMIGGGGIPKPGEISLAHRGVLFLDEFPEFSRRVLESLRQPMEDGKVTISRSRGSVTYPSKFILVAARNPCPCGYFGTKIRRCNCTQYERQRYYNRISGPMLDRIDMQVKIGSTSVKEISRNRQQKTPSSETLEIKSRVIKARERQRQRYFNIAVKTNSEVNTRQLSKYCIINSRPQMVLDLAKERFSFSNRVYFKLVRTAQTIADLNLKSQNSLSEANIQEAIQYRTETKG